MPKRAIAQPKIQFVLAQIICPIPSPTVLMIGTEESILDNLNFKEEPKLRTVKSRNYFLTVENTCHSDEMKLSRVEPKIL